MQEKDKLKKLNEALYKKAIGFSTEEITEEYQEKEGDIVLIKKKVTKKTVPPDITALKIIMDSTTTDVKNMTDEELEQEKQRLLALIKQGELDVKK